MENFSRELETLRRHQMEVPEMKNIILSGMDWLESKVQLNAELLNC